MKHLIDHILESFETKQKTLVDFIQNTNDQEIINTLYNTYKKIYKDSNDEDSYFNSIKQLIEEKMSARNDDKHLKSFLQSIYGSCEKYNCYEQIGIIAKEQLIKNEKSFFSIKLDSNKHNYQIKLNDIKEYFNNFLKDIIENKNKPYKAKGIEYHNIPDGFWTSIFKKEAPGQPVMGKGEFLLVLICEYPDGKGGDVTINGESVEVKNLGSNEAKIGNAEKGHVLPIFNFLNEIKNDSIDDIKPQTLNKNVTKGNSEVFTNIKSIIEGIKESEKDTLIKILQEKLNNDFYFDKKTNVNKKYVEQAIEYLIELKNKNLELKEFSNQFVKIFTILYIILYCNSENAKYICLIDTNTNFNFIPINDNTFANSMKDDNFPVFMIRYSGVKLILIKY